MRLPSLITMFCSFVATTMLSAAPVKSIEVKAGLMPFTLYSKGSVRMYYNKDSSLIGLSYYDNQGNKYATQNWFYDGFGTVERKELIENLSWFNSRETTFSYQYSATNRVLEENQNYKWNQRQLKYKYDLLGNIKTIHAYDTTGFFPIAKESIKNIYTNEGQLDSRIFFDKNGRCVLTQKWIYDLSGRKAEFQTLDGYGDLIWGTQYAYDAATGCDIETQFGPSREVLSYIYTYHNDLGRIFERDLRDAFGSVITITMIDYNLIGQITRVADYDRDKIMIGYINTFYDIQSRPYQHDFSYSDHDILRDRVQEHLKLAGNDL